MAVLHRQPSVEAEAATEARTETHSDGGSRPPESGALRRALAALRISYGVIFVWAFLDKAFALGFHTGYGEDGTLDRFGPAAWVNGGSPTTGFLSFAVPETNPFRDFFTSLAGQAWVDWVFMLGLLGIGIGLLLGIAMRLSTAAGAVMYAFMWAASLPLENNPVIDDHLVGVIVMAVLALGAAGTTWGLGRRWEATRPVAKVSLLR